jgi:hypothetical protein
MDTGVCFYRYEDSGVMNVTPSYIRVNNKKIAEVGGGEMKCIHLKPGTYTIDADGDSYNPDPKNKLFWLSNKMKIAVKNNVTTYVHVWPRSSDKGYTGPWDMELTNPPKISDFIN